jgi:hypothetical protein
MEINYWYFKACESILKNCKPARVSNRLEVCEYRGNKVIQVTDGNRLALINLGAVDDFFPIIITAENALAVIKAFKPPKKDALVTLHFSNPDAGKVRVNSSYHDGKMVTCPPTNLEMSTEESTCQWQKIVDEKVDRMESYVPSAASFNLDYLQDAVKMAEILGNSLHHSPTCRVIGPDNLSAHIALPGHGSHDCLLYIVMPMREEGFNLPLWAIGAKEEMKKAV